MGLTTAMYTGLSGLNVNQARIDVIGNNIANVNTTAYKGSRMLFQTQLAQTISAGSAPSATTGGTNPFQIGLGAVVGTTQRNFNSGSIETTGVASDLAVEGNGFFVLRDGQGQQGFTRDGSFSVNSDNRLVTLDGRFVQGYGVDSNFGIVPNVLSDLTIPLGTLSLARSTENVRLDGDLSAAGTLATLGGEVASQALVRGGGAAADASTALTDVRSASAAGVALFEDGNTITVSRVTKGDRELPPQTFVVGTTGSTLGEFAAWLNGALGINTTTGVPGTPGATIEGGQLIIRSNTGEQNDIEISAGDFASDSATTPLPLTFTQNAAASGSSVYTAFTVYDSLGSPVVVNATFALESTPDTGPVWRYYLETPDGSGAARTVGTGTVAFDTQGNFRAVTGNQFTIDRSATGATTPLGFTLDLSGVHGLSTQTSNVVMSDQDGFPPGTLTNYAIGADGSVTGVFTNGLTRTLGQVALATFANQEGLVADGDNLYLQGVASGPPSIVTPGTFGAGRVRSGALELSNVDLAQEFIGLVTSSTGFQASSRVISVSSDLLDQLLVIIR